MVDVHFLRCKHFLTFVRFSSRTTDTEHGSLNVLSTDENKPGGALKKFKGRGDDDDNEDVTEKTPPSTLELVVPEQYYMFQWTNSKMRDCVNVLVNLTSGSTAYMGMSNLNVTATTEGNKSFLLITYKWNECLLEVKKLYPFIKEGDKDEDFWTCFTAHKH